MHSDACPDYKEAATVCLPATEASSAVSVWWQPSLGACDGEHLPAALTETALWPAQDW